LRNMSSHRIVVVLLQGSGGLRERLLWTTSSTWKPLYASDTRGHGEIRIHIAVVLPPIHTFVYACKTVHLWWMLKWRPMWS